MIGRNITIIEGFVKYKGDTKIEKFYDVEKLNLTNIDFNYIENIIDVHYTMIEDDAYFYRKILKYPTFYRFKVSKYEYNKLTSEQTVCFIRKVDFDSEWKSISNQIKTFTDKVSIISKDGTPLKINPKYKVFPKLRDNFPGLLDDFDTNEVFN